MKKVFEDDSSYIDVKAKDGGKVIVTLCARHSNQSDNVTMVSVEMDAKEFKELVGKSLE